VKSAVRQQETSGRIIFMTSLASAGHRLFSRHFFPRQDELKKLLANFLSMLGHRPARKMPFFFKMHSRLQDERDVANFG